jgi:hypothetical protein
VIIIAIEGVLAEPGPAWALRAATLFSGRQIYNAFLTDHRIVLLSSEPDPERYRSWLLKEHFRHFSEVHAIPADSPDTVQNWKVQKVRELSAGPIMFYVDSDPAVISRVVADGVPTLLAVNPATFPGKGSGGRYTPWDELVGTIEEQNLIRAIRQEGS